MSFRREVPREETFSGFVTLRETFGFVPKLFQAQTLLPRLIEAEAQILSAVFRQGALSRVQKECVFVSYYTELRRWHQWPDTPREVLCR